jgi:hypothetical protein
VETPDHEKEKLLQEIAEGLEHSRELIAQIDELLAQRHELLYERRRQRA